ncbi:DUF3298 domain-containing protein [Paludibacter sp. 221]|uniref:RsiV family protein n=1 Tax=Paludibacter sp. 221 TaxID=2302939 RepID=UPI0013D107F0|nr:RsiV family protein [Paludibacter sp. 221]NDV46961.1 DUF3298 domain-containing protein [Paludibacter sp. 221]
MKKNFFRFSACLLTVFFFYSCGSDVVETELFQFSKKYYLTQDTVKGVLEVNARIEIPSKYKDAAVLKSVRNDIVEKLFGNKYLQYANSEILQRFALSMEKEYRANNLPFVEDLASDEIGFAYNNDYMLESFALLNDGHLFSYGSDLYVYMGGAHGITHRLYYNYDLRDGKLLTENDLFVDGYKPRVTELMKKYIAENNGLSSSEADFVENYWVDQIRPNGNFYITTEGINYVFNPYEIAPYSFGHTEVRLPFAQIEGIIKANSPIAYLITAKQ